MNAHSAAVSAGSSPLRRWTLRVLPWLSAGILVAGLIALVIVRSHSSIATHDNLSNAPAKVVPPAGKPGKLPAAVRKVAGRFILTAVARKNVDESWMLVTPQFKQGYTLAQWRTGNIPVIPFPMDKVEAASIKVDSLTAREALIRVFLIPKSVKVKGQIFAMDLKLVGKGKHQRWLVDSWVPYSSIAVPRNTN